MPDDDIAVLERIMYDVSDRSMTRVYIRVTVTFKDLSSMSEMLRSVPGCATVLSMTMQNISSSSMCSPPGTQTTVMFLDMVVCGDAEMHGKGKLSTFTFASNE